MIKYLLPATLLMAGCNISTASHERDAIRTKHPQQIVSAYSYYGWTESKNRKELTELVGVDPVETEWCAAFVNAVLHGEGIEGSETVSAFPLTARSFVTWGTEVKKPQSGDVVVFPRGEPWQGHVGFYVRTVMVEGVPNYLILGGNQDNSVSLKLYPATQAIAIRRHSPQLL